MWMSELVTRKDFNVTVFWTLLFLLAIIYVLVAGTEAIVKAHGKTKVSRALAEKGIHPYYAPPYCCSHSEHLERVDDELSVYLECDDEPVTPVDTEEVKDLDESDVFRNTDA